MRVTVARNNVSAWPRNGPYRDIRGGEGGGVAVGGKSRRKDKKEKKNISLVFMPILRKQIPRQ